MRCAGDARSSDEDRSDHSPGIGDPDGRGRRATSTRTGRRASRGTPCLNQPDQLGRSIRCCSGFLPTRRTSSGCRRPDERQADGERHIRGWISMNQAGRRRQRGGSLVAEQRRKLRSASGGLEADPPAALALEEVEQVGATSKPQRELRCRSGRQTRRSSSALAIRHPAASLIAMVTSISAHRRSRGGPRGGRGRSVDMGSLRTMTRQVEPMLLLDLSLDTRRQLAPGILTRLDEAGHALVDVLGWDDHRRGPNGSQSCRCSAGDQPWRCY